MKCVCKVYALKKYYVVHYIINVMSDHMEKFILKDIHRVTNVSFGLESK